MTAAEQADATAETRAEQRAREAAERAEWDRLSDIYFAHMNAIAPDQFHCFCGSLDDLREAVADLDRQAARDPARRPTAAQAANRGLAHQDHTQTLPDQARREQLNRWHADDRAAEHGADDADAE
ncbi:hypothetical protein [Actinomycetospora lemnae]|uniref:DUF222 domain-containing protein n=1 Tax=Actinomycetospora lemnae TaxID=3019891 RepID=A0ABT5SYK2_9PSEU|nr:hypothetical protein [Actinomycetospora sp. DW7H6]MDD7967791.1 hypothetical protein [Actinomycetospora sp. DW7H6]